MNKIKILTIVGARPQFIKASVVSAEMLKHPALEEIIVHTGQHFDPVMSEVFFNQLHIPQPKYSLHINQLSHGAMTGRMMEEIEKIILHEKPNFVMLYGDANSTLAGALAAKKTNAKVVHIEAGLRSFNMKMPEEINRILTDRISDILFCPTEVAVENLHKEGFSNFDCLIENSGDVMYDACLFFKQYAVELDVTLPENYALATLHRPENTDVEENLRNIFASLIEISQTLPVVIPLHPRTIQLIEKYNINLSSANLMMLPPQSYLEMLHLLQHCRFLMTDSGGLQKEAYFLHKLCLTLRNETEWVELCSQKANVLVGNTKEGILAAYENINQLAANACFDKEFYGKGNAAKKIIDTIETYHYN
ncbi:MAG: UDP-N-acetylglucosamine 2-epimerase (non-hydrolyzing) [Bacteroidota bacterium]